MSTSTSMVHPQDLPPTNNAARYHSYRVYLQTQGWLGNSLDATSWGWQILGSHFVPINFDTPYAPKSLIGAIYCNCKTVCVRANCTCRKHSLSCTMAYGLCKGSCSNLENKPIADD